MDQKEDKGLRYRDAGVDIDAATDATRLIKEMVRSTFTSGVLTDIGGFGGLFKLPEGVHEPVLVSSTDGVGTKLKIAFMTGKHDTVGEDLVNHCTNDILTTGARPLFFLDYIATGRLEPGIVADIVSGLAKACRENSCALVGGEIAEMPDFYRPGEYDLAGTIVGLAAESKILSGETIKPGNLLMGLPSSGLHTNGYSLARKVFFEVLKKDVNDEMEELGCSVGEELLRPHLSYGPVLRKPIDKGWISSLAHITGGGITDNLPRALPEGCGAVVKHGSWPVPPVFEVIQRAGRIEEKEMLRVFNTGVGMIAVVTPEHADTLENHLREHGDGCFQIGEVVKGKGEVRYV